MPQSRRNEQLINTTDRREQKDQPNKIKLNRKKSKELKMEEYFVFYNTINRL